MSRESVRPSEGFEPRRVIAFLALLAVLVVVVAGAAHVAAPDHHDEGGCSLCVAYFASAVAALFAPALLVLLSLPHRAHVVRPAVVPIASRRAFLAAPRGPPAGA